MRDKHNKRTIEVAFNCNFNAADEYGDSVFTNTLLIDIDESGGLPIIDDDKAGSIHVEDYETTLTRFRDEFSLDDFEAEIFRSMVYDAVMAAAGRINLNRLVRKITIKG